MAEKGPPAPTPKPGKTKIPVAKYTTAKTEIPLEPRVIIRPIDYQQSQNALNPPNQPDQLPEQQPNIPNPRPPLPIPAHLQIPLNPPPPLQIPPNPPPPPPINLNLPPNPPNPPTPPPNPEDPMNPPNPPQPQQLNWSYFKPEFSGKPEEDATVHLLKTNDWMEMHNFPDDTKVRRFCLTLVGEARLWYESLRPIEMDWLALQEHFRWQYSKFGSSREQYIHIWRSFHYDENTDTLDSYILKIKQVALLLNYGEPGILELFKNTLPRKLYWLLFSINNLREAVDTAKRVSPRISPFLNMRDNKLSGQQVLMKLQDSETVTSMMNNMSLQQGKTKKPFKPQVYQKRGRGQRQNYNRNRPRSNNRQGQHFGQNRHRNDYRRNGYMQNFSRTDGRDRGRRSFNRSYSSDRSRSRERSLLPREYDNNNSQKIKV